MRRDDGWWEWRRRPRRGSTRPKATFAVRIIVTLTVITLSVTYKACGSIFTMASPTNVDDLLPLAVATFHILVAVADQDRHGYAIMQDVAARTNGALKLSPGTLYGSIRRMLDGGLIVELSARQRPDEDDERRRYYRITPFGRSVAQAEATRLATLLRQARAVGLAPGRA